MRPAEGTLAAAPPRSPLRLLGRTDRRLRRLSGIALCAAVSLTGTVAPALAQSPRHRTTPSLGACASTLAGELQAAYTKLDVLDEAYDRAQSKVKELRHSVAVATAAIWSSQRRLSSATTRLRSVAIDAYVTSDTSTGLAVLVQGGRSQPPEQQAYLSAATGALKNSISSYVAARRLVSERRAGLVAAERAAEATARQIGRDKQAAASTTAALEATLSQVKGKLVGLVAQRENAAQKVARGGPAARPRTPARHRGGGGHSSGGRGHSSGGGGGGSSGGGGGSGEAAVRAAESQLGVPYVYGGATPGVGFDCSGLTMWAWAQAGVSLSHGATDQYYATRHVSMSDLRPGDLIFYGSAGYLYHVVMYVGSGPYGRDTVIQAEHTGTVVMFTPLYGGYYGASEP